MSHARGRERAGVVVEQGEHSLGRVEELRDLGDVEACLEFLPHVGPQPVAVAATELVGSFQGVGWRVQKVACRLADVDEEGAAGGVDVRPKV